MRSIILIVAIHPLFFSYSHSQPKWKDLTSYEVTDLDSISELSNKRISKVTSLYASKFRGGEVRNTNFSENLIIIQTQFSDAISFNNTIFQDTVFLIKIKLDDQIEFDWSEFRDFSLFDDLAITKLTMFHTEFKAEVVMEDSEFHNVFFTNAKFKSNLLIQNVKFQSKLIFDHSTFDGAVTLRDVQLPKYISFSNIRTENEINLVGTTTLNINGTEAKYEPNYKCEINLIDAPIEKLNMTYDNFRVYRPGINLTKLQYQQLNSVYERLLKNFKDRGYLSSYKSLFREYQQFKSRSNPENSLTKKIFSVIRNSFRSMWNDYGFANERILIITPTLFLIFCALNWLLLKRLSVNIYTIKNITEKVTSVETSKPTLYLLGLSFYYTCLVFFGLKMTIENLKFERFWGVFYILIQYVTGLICLGYIANFILNNG